tara:strand:+ start:13098 stop:14468 length:1371 start_codon:yes stop_codon:yes gene_type:complete
MKVNPFVFREYDIRGVVKDDFPSEFINSLGKAFGTYVKRLGAKEISLSGDVRLTTPKLKKEFKEGVLDTGIDVIDIGILPTPVNYYSMWKLGVGAAVQITGSHNPAEMNGFKMSINKSAVYGEQIQELKTLIEREDFESGTGTEVRYKLIDEYIEMIQKKIRLERSMNLVIDCGNAAACLAAPQIFDGLDADVTGLFCDIDGSFPNHHPDPTVIENISKLISTMKQGGFEAGIAYDGDADRLGLVDEKGRIIFADQIMALMLPEIVKKDEEILFDIKCSQGLEEEIVRLGGKPIIWKTGHSLIKEKMKELSCKFGGEMSGHIFFADDYFGFDDAIYASARLIQMLSRQEKKLSDLVSELPQYYSTPEIRLNCSDDQEKFRINEKAKIYFKENYDCLDIDGVRVKFSDGWGLVRASNTQPVIVCRFESKTEERTKEIQELILNKIKDFGEVDVSDVF